MRDPFPVSNEVDGVKNRENKSCYRHSDSFLTFVFNVWAFIMLSGVLSGSNFTTILRRNDITDRQYRSAWIKF